MPRQAGEIAAEIGFPVLLKASAGGGGKGMRIVDTPAELPGSFEAASREAKSAFGDGCGLPRAVSGPSASHRDSGDGRPVRSGPALRREGVLHPKETSKAH